MTRPLRLLLLAVLSAAVSCSAPRNVAFVPAGTVADVAFIMPCCQISGPEGASLSDLAGDLVCTAILNTRVPVARTVPMTFGDDAPGRTEWMLRLAGVRPSKASELQVPEDLRRAALGSGLQYGMATLVTGEAGEKHVTECCSAIFDASTGKVVYFARIRSNRCNPGSYLDVKSLITRMFRSYSLHMQGWRR